MIKIFLIYTLLATGIAFVSFGCGAPTTPKRAVRFHIEEATSDGPCKVFILTDTETGNRYLEICSSITTYKP